MVEHKKRYESFGPKTETGGMKVVCTCGWKSEPVYNYDDYRNHNLDRLFGLHLQEIKKAQTSD